jgi:shikimate kinase
MGVGKTTVGKLLAKKLDYDFIDMDIEIEKKEGITIKEIFQIQGEEKFRQLETCLVKELSEKDRTIIACGGGTIANPDNAEILQKTSKMVFLTASIEEIIKRTSHDNIRPLLNVKNPVKIVAELYEKRKPVYKKYAEAIVDTTGKTPKEVVEILLDVLR